MVNLKSIAASLFMLTSSLSGFHAFAQNANTFGATIRNPGSMLPEWWNEGGYIPERLEEALHLRMGSSGNFGGTPSLGRVNCDMAMLYSAKSNIPIAPAEMEYCALLEFYLYQGVSGDKRSLNDGFVRKDTIAEFTEVVKKRINLFRQNNTYYLRAGAAQLDPFDLKLGGMVMRFNWTQGYIPMDEKVGRPTTITYKFDEPHFRKSDDRWWGVLLTDDEQGGREMEAARANNRFITALNFFTFDVTGTREVKDLNGISRYLKVKVKHFSIPYVTGDGRTVTTGIKA